MTEVNVEFDVSNALGYIMLRVSCRYCGPVVIGQKVKKEILSRDLKLKEVFNAKIPIVKEIINSQHNNFEVPYHPLSKINKNGTIY